MFLRLKCSCLSYFITLPLQQESHGEREMEARRTGDWLVPEEKMPTVLLVFPRFPVQLRVQKEAYNTWDYVGLPLSVGGACKVGSTLGESRAVYRNLMMSANLKACLIWLWGFQLRSLSSLESVLSIPAKALHQANYKSLEVTWKQK